MKFAINCVMLASLSIFLTAGNCGQTPAPQPPPQPPGPTLTPEEIATALCTSVARKDAFSEVMADFATKGCSDKTALPEIFSPSSFNPKLCGPGQPIYEMFMAAQKEKSIVVDWAALKACQALGEEAKKQFATFGGLKQYTDKVTQAYEFDVCKKMVVPQRKENEQCQAYFECVAPLNCLPDFDDQSRSTCQKAPTEGNKCQGIWCAKGLQCDSSANKCVKKSPFAATLGQVVDGDYCDPFNVGHECRESCSTCLGASSKCGAFVGIGGVCKINTDCESGVCANDLCIAKLAAGQACNARECQDNLGCIGADFIVAKSGKCGNKLQANASCRFPDECASGACVVTSKALGASGTCGLGNDGSACGQEFSGKPNQLNCGPNEPKSLKTLYCTDTFVCKERALGEKCDFSNETACPWQSRCVSGVCVPDWGKGGQACTDTDKNHCPIGSCLADKGKCVSSSFRADEIDLARWMMLR